MSVVDDSRSKPPVWRAGQLLLQYHTMTFIATLHAADKSLHFFDDIRIHIFASEQFTSHFDLIRTLEGDIEPIN